VTRRRTQAGLLLLLVWLTALPAAATDDNWSASDVEAADRYREQERERAERYRARLETAPGAEPQAGAATPRGESGGARSDEGGFGERIAAGLRAWFDGLLADLVRSVTDALRGVVDELFGIRDEKGDAPPQRLTPAPVGGFNEWLRREQGRAREWLEGEKGAAPAPAADAREWQQREAARAREAARREASAARERSPRKQPPGPEERWQERWGDASAWEAEERARLEAQRRD
jgi:hypothetical protein